MPIHNNVGGAYFNLKNRGVLDTRVEYPHGSWIQYTVGGVRCWFLAPTSIPANSPAPDQVNTLWVELEFRSHPGSKQAGRYIDGGRKQCETALKILRSWAVSAVDEMSSSCTKHMAEVEEAVKVLENLITVSGKKE